VCWWLVGGLLAGLTVVAGWLAGINWVVGWLLADWGG